MYNTYLIPSICALETRTIYKNNLTKNKLLETRGTNQTLIRKHLFSTREQVFELDKIQNAAISQFF